MPEAERIILVSKGAPADHAKLNVEWQVDAAEPDVHDRPHFVNERGTLHLYHNTNGMWTIAPEVDAGIAYAIARSTALHPNTIRAGEWQLPGRTEWMNCPSFKVAAEGPNTEEFPYDVHADLGDDFFLRMRTTKVVWFRDPATNEVVHSGAKAAGNSKKLGKRYCPLCHQCFSANNFVSQHVKNMHTPPAPSTPMCYPDGKGGVHLVWRADDFPQMALPLSFFVQFSVDGGEKWSTGIEDTQSADTRAHISTLSPHLTYIFKVGANGIAAHGRLSEPSLPFSPDAENSPPQALLPPRQERQITAQLPTLPTVSAVSPGARATLPSPTGMQQAPPPMVEMTMVEAIAAPVGNSIGYEPGIPVVQGHLPPNLEAKPLQQHSDAAVCAPQSPPLTPMSAESASNEGGGGGHKRGRGDDELSAVSRVPTAAPRRVGDPCDETLASIDLMWSLDDLCREALSAEDEGAKAFERFFGSAKRSRLASSDGNMACNTDEFMEFLFGSLNGGGLESQPKASVIMGGTGSQPNYRILPGESAALCPDTRGDVLAEHSHNALLAEASRDASLRRLDEAASSHRSSFRPANERSHSKAAAAQPVLSSPIRGAPRGHGELSKEEIQEESKKASLAQRIKRLTRLRLALTSAPAAAKERLLTPHFLAAIGTAPNARREFALLMSHAPASAVQAAAAENIMVEHAIEARRSGRPLPRGVGSFNLKQRLKHVRNRATAATKPPLLLRAAVGVCAAVVIAAVLPLVAFAAPDQWPHVASRLLVIFQPSSPQPLPQCHWSWSAGCVPSNEATVSCQLALLNPGQLCQPHSI